MSDHVYQGLWLVTEDGEARRPAHPVEIARYLTTTGPILTYLDRLDEDERFAYVEALYLECDEDGDVIAEHTTTLDQLGAFGLIALEVFLDRFGAFVRATTEVSHA